MTTTGTTSTTAHARRLAPARMSLRDLIRVGGAGIRTHPTRILLSALGIAIGIAAMISVVGISSSSREDFNRQIAELGTNLLAVSPGQNVFGEQAHLPAEAVPMIDNIGPVDAASATAVLPVTHVYRNDKVPAQQSGGISVIAGQTDLLDTLGGDLAAGAFLNRATATYPAVVLGATTAERLGVGVVGPDQQVFLGGHWFTVVGILNPVPLSPEIDTSAIIGWSIATELLNFDGYATTVYVRAAQHAVEPVQAVLAATANPAAPNEADVSRPSDALAAQHAADNTLNALLLGLGAVALLVGGIGVANTMIITVLERRGEIGLRRSLGATRGNIRAQFLTEALLLSLIGGIGGLLLGLGVTALYATLQSWPTVVPPWAMGLGLTATIIIGGIAGLHPAIRASKLPPTEALTNP